jgi:hypothetical protein
MSEQLLSFSGNVASILGFVIGLIGIALAIYFYIRGTKRPGHTYKVHPVRTPIVRAGAVSRLSILHDGHEIKSDITAAHIAIWNQVSRGSENSLIRGIPFSLTLWVTPAVPWGLV